jgi:acyl-CoA thioester hydrolase
MPRIKLQMPEKTIAVFPVRVRVTDINYGNHVGNDAFVSIIHEARMQWLQQLGYTELDIEGTGLLITELIVEFKSEVFYGAVLDVSIGMGEISKAGFELYYQLCMQRNNETVLAAVAKTGMICYNYTAKKVAAIPEKFKNLLV